MAKRSAPEVNAGSMADIAFLLLIFFLVTTTIEKDSGIPTQLPPLDQEAPEINIKQKNIFQVSINKNNQVFVETAGEGKVVELKDLRQMAIAFIDNGGGTDKDGNRCDYCKGARKSNSSDHPSKAIVSLQNDGETSYGSFVQVKNELMGAFNDLRDRESMRLYNEPYEKIVSDYQDNPFAKNRDKLKGKVDDVKALFPLMLSESEAKKN